MARYFGREPADLLTLFLFVGFISVLCISRCVPW